MPVKLFAVAAGLTKADFVRTVATFGLYGIYKTIAGQQEEPTTITLQQRRKTKDVSDLDSTDWENNKNSSNQEGNKKRSRKEAFNGDNCSNSNNNNDDDNNEQNKKNNNEHDKKSYKRDKKEKSVKSHLMSRLKRFIRLLGMVERRSLEFGIQRSKIIENGPSEGQDRRSGLTRKYHSAHIIQARVVKSFRQLDKGNVLFNFISHTHIVPQHANTGIGRRLDSHLGRILRQFVDKDLEYDFTFETPSSEMIEWLHDFINEFIGVIENKIRQIESDESRESEVQDLKEAIEGIREINIHDLIQRGRDGYNGTYDQKYYDEE